MSGCISSCIDCIGLIFDKFAVYLGSTQPHLVDLLAIIHAMYTIAEHALLKGMRASLSP